jgi:hypothetical protein
MFLCWPNICHQPNVSLQSIVYYQPNICHRPNVCLSAKCLSVSLMSVGQPNVCRSAKCLPFTKCVYFSQMSVVGKMSAVDQLSAFGQMSIGQMSAYGQMSVIGIMSVSETFVCRPNVCILAKCLYFGQMFVFWPNVCLWPNVYMSAKYLRSAKCLSVGEMPVGQMFFDQKAWKPISRIQPAKVNVINLLKKLQKPEGLTAQPFYCLNRNKLARLSLSQTLPP